MSVAIGEEDDPPQHPCEQSYNEHVHADYINNRCTMPGFRGFSPENRALLRYV